MQKWVFPAILLFLILLATNAIPALRGHDSWGWQWTYESPERWFAVGMLAALLILYLSSAYWLQSRQAVYPLLIWGIVAGTALGYSAVHIRDDALFLMFTRTVSPVQTGASTVTVEYMSKEGLHHTLDNWTTVMEEAHDRNIIHFTTTPPGQALVHYWTGQAFQNNEMLSRDFSMALRPYQCSNVDIMAYRRHEVAGVLPGLLMPFFAALMIIPVYLTVKQLTGDKSTALKSARSSPLIPAILLFAPTWNTLYPFLCISAFALLVRGIQKQQPLLIILAGSVMSITTFLNFSVIPVLMIMGLYTLGHYIWITRQQTENPPAWHWPVQTGVWFGLGLISVWTIYWLYSGYTPFDLFQVSLEQHRTLVQRNYWIWLFAHLYDTFLFIGWPVIALGLWSLWQSVRQRPTTPLQIATISLFLTIITLTLSGTVQGENGRILMFYAPFFLVVNSQWFLKHPKPLADSPMMSLQAATVLVMASVLAVVPLDLNPPPTGPRPDIPELEWLEPQPVIAEFASEQYEGRFRLNSYRYVVDTRPDNESVTIEFLWEGIARTERPYYFEVIASMDIEDYGTVTLAPYRWYPQNGNYLTPCWQNGDRIREVKIIPLTAAPQGIWHLELRAVDIRTDDIAGSTTLDIRYIIDG